MAISVDDEQKNAAMTEKLGLGFPLLADPDGEGAIKPFGVWHPDEERARPAVVALAPDGRELYRYAGEGAPDRPPNDEALEAVRALGLPSRAPAEGIHPHGEPRPSEQAARIETMKPFFKGMGSGAKAIWERGGGSDVHADRVARMAGSFSDGLDALP